MKLASAANYFDRVVCTDAFNPGVSFKAQMDLYDDTRRDGLTANRRILSVSPSIDIPARRSILIDGSGWIVGNVNKDFFGTDAIRSKYIIEQADFLVPVRSFSEVLSNAAGTYIYAGRLWVKDIKEVDFSSNTTNEYQIFAGISETINDGSLILLGSKWYLTRSTYQSAGGFLVAVGDELPDPVQVSAVISRRVYQPTSDTYVTTPLTLSALRIRWQSHFVYPQQGAEKYKAGDTVLIVLTSQLTLPVAGDKVIVEGENYIIVSFRQEDACWVLHLRNA